MSDVRHLTPARLTPARQRLLEALKLTEPATAAGLAAELDLTEAAVRQHLAALVADGIVTPTATTAARPGRPAARWSLTDDGRRLFADRHGELAVQLVQAIRAALGEGALDRVLDTRAQQQRAAYRSVIQASGRSPRARVDALAAQRTAEGYMAEVVDDDDAFLLVEHHCPIADAARSCGGLCRAELELFRDALGEDLAVERVEHLVAGARRCTYRVAPT